MCRLLFSFQKNPHSEIDIKSFYQALESMKNGGPDATGIEIFRSKSIIILNRLSLKDQRSIANQPFYPIQIS